MTSACLLMGATVLQLATPVFTLSWAHSVERVEWRETWEVGEERLTLRDSAVKGSGAGMEPGPDAQLENGWWVSPGGLSVERLALAASGATGGGWTLCSGQTCHLLGASTGMPWILAPCSAAAAQGHSQAGGVLRVEVGRQSSTWHSAPADQPSGIIVVLRSPLPWPPLAADPTLWPT